MPDGKQEEEEEPKEFLPPRDIQSWARQQIKDAAKEFELRVKEVTSLATAYSAGEIAPNQAEERYFRYYHRWGDALCGVSVGDDWPDDKIIAKIDESRDPFITPQDRRARRSRPFKQSPDDSGHSR